MNEPTVSVLVPVLNEERAIGECLDRVLASSCAPREVLVADGGSTDGTRGIIERIMSRDARVRLVSNPRRIQSAGLNQALRLATGDVIVRVDARSFVDADYIARCVATLRHTGAAVVGGRMVARSGATVVEQGIALANRSWWGAGPARFHAAGDAGPVDTVYLGAFDRDWLQRVGGWSDDLPVNEDYELNYRIRRAGGVVWYDPMLQVEYEARRSYSALARQYFRYGRSKATVLWRHPASVQPRQVVPLSLPVLAAAATRPRAPSSRVARTALVLHLSTLAALAIRTDKSQLRVRGAATIAGAIMHWAWALGAVAGISAKVLRSISGQR